MILKKIISAAVTSLVLFNSFSATVYAASDESVLNYSPYDMTRLERLSDAFCAECLKSDNDEGVVQAYYDLLNEYNYVYDSNVISMLQYNLKSTEENYQDYSDSSVIQTKALYMIIETLQKAYNETDYKELIGYLSGMDDETGNADFDDSSYENGKLDFIQRYYSIKQNPGLTDDEKEYMTAQLYIEYAQYYNNALKESGYENSQDYFYTAYNRDYSFRDTERLGNSVKSIVRDYFNYAVNSSKKCSNIPATRSSLVFNDNIEVLNRYACMVSDEAAESAALILDRGLYFQGGNPDSSDLTYTVYLFSERMPLIYQYIENTNSDFGTLVHEFGHFNSMYHPSEFINYIEVSGDCIDIAELQSQGMSVLFTEYYEDIYGRYAKNMELYTLYNMLHTIASSFLVNDIEKYVFENADTLTPDDVLNRFSDLKDEYEIIRFRLSDINHIFETPFYYISYGLSALAAFELWDEMCRDHEKAVRMYTDITHVSIYDADNTFVDSLQKCGFSADIFDPRIMDDIIGNVVYTISGDRVYGDVNESGSVNGADLKYLENKIMSAEAIIDERELKKCDLKRDGLIDVNDLLLLKTLLLN